MNKSIPASARPSHVVEVMMCQKWSEINVFVDDIQSVAGTFWSDRVVVRSRCSKVGCGGLRNLLRDGFVVGVWNFFCLARTCGCI